MSLHILAVAGSPRRHGNTEELLDAAVRGCREAAPDVEVVKLVLNELNIRPCQNCGYCDKKGECVFDKDDDMGSVRAALDAADRFVLASPIFFANVSAQLKTMIDRCQAYWARKYLLKKRAPSPPRRALFLSCGGFKRDHWSDCARRVVETWAMCLDANLDDFLFYHPVDARGEVRKHPAALREAFEAGRRLARGPSAEREKTP